MALFNVVILRVTGELAASIEAANESDALVAALQQEDGHEFASPEYRRVSLLESTLAASTAGATLAESTNETKAIRPPA